jgi:hypothetical protein
MLQTRQQEALCSDDHNANGRHGEASQSNIHNGQNERYPAFGSRVHGALWLQLQGPTPAPRWRTADGFLPQVEPEHLPILVRVRIVGQCPSEGDVQEAGGSPNPPALPVDALY